jgi:hypothetical protein
MDKPKPGERYTKAEIAERIAARLRPLIDEFNAESKRASDAWMRRGHDPGDEDSER